MLCRILLSVSLVTATFVAAPAIAAACGNAMFVDGDDAVKQVAEAERLLASGKLKRAQDLVGRRYRFEDKGVQTRADIVNATVAFRLESNPDSWQVKHGISTLQRLLKAEKDNPIVMARLAEGFRISPETREQAQALLEDLAERDLMPDAYGYRTLALLRAAAGESEAADAALVMCKSMTKQKQMCSLVEKKVKAGKGDKKQRRKARRARAAVKS